MTTSTAKKSAKKVSDIPLQKSRRVIQLDQSQYALYQSGQLDIYSPDALLLESIGEALNTAEAEVHRYKLRDQLSLVEALVINSSGQLELSESATAGLAQLLFESQQQLSH
jgi:hypothetical protein